MYYLSRVAVHGSPMLDYGVSAVQFAHICGISVRRLFHHPTPSPKHSSPNTLSVSPETGPLARTELFRDTIYTYILLYITQYTLYRVILCSVCVCVCVLAAHI